MMKIAIAGWSGLVGTKLLEQAAEHNDVEELHLLGRKKGEERARVQYHQVELSDISLELKFDEAFCCLGTTMKKAGSKDAFYTVDHDYVLNFAKWAKANGAKSFHFVSATGISKKSAFFYNRVKAETEEDLKKLGFENLFFYRPSLLLGDRNEFRFGEKIGEIVMKLFSPLMIGSFKRYRPVHDKQVARAMLMRLGANGYQIIESEQMSALKV